MNVLAIIPARGGSKGVPDKNIAAVGGKPLLAWTIIEVRKSKHIDRVIVSTDSQKIAQVAREYGADVPFLRPADLAKDDTPGIDPIIHAVNWLSVNEKYQPDYVMCLQPTSPFRTADDIDASVKIIENEGADAVVSVAVPEHSPYWMKSINAEGWLEDFLPGRIRFMRRQDVPQVYALNGAIYLIKRDILLEINSLHPEKTYPYIMPAERSLDIDTPWDLYISNLILSDYHK